MILNFSDFRPPNSGIAGRTTPVTSLTGAFQRRVVRKGGTFAIHHMADLFGAIRIAKYRAIQNTECEGILTERRLRTLVLDAVVDHGQAWRTIVNDCRQADKVILAAHGHADDTDNVYTEISQGVSVRCGDVRGIVLFLKYVLENAQRNPTITLSICYAARSAEHHKHHVTAALTETNLRSSLAFKIFAAISSSWPNVRLTARTGAVSADDIGTSLTSETEEAIIAAERIDAEFPDADTLVASVQRAYGVLDAAIGQSSLDRNEKRSAQDRLYQWFMGGFDPDVFSTLIDDVERMDWSHRNVGASIGWLVGMNSSWKERFATDIKALKDLAVRRRRLFELKATSEEKAAKYGKFIYHRDQNHIYVSRMHLGHLTQLLRVNA